MYRGRRSKLLLVLGLCTVIVILLKSYAGLQNQIGEGVNSRSIPPTCHDLCKIGIFRGKLGHSSTGLYDFFPLYPGSQLTTLGPQPPLVEMKAKPKVAKKSQVLLDWLAARAPAPAIQWCLPLHYLTAPATRPVTALASAPGSGNTWLRYLLQQASGVYTGSIYNDWDLKRKGFLAENVRDGSVSVVKLHEWGTKTLTLYQRAVLLIRSPAPAILAEFNRRFGGHTGFAPVDRFSRDDGKYWGNYVDGQLRDWQALYLTWLRNFTGPLHVVQYEALRDDLDITLQATLQFLDLPLDEEALQCTAGKTEGSHKRLHHEDEFDPFTPLMKDKLLVAENLVLDEVKKHQSRKQRSLS